MIHMVSDGFIGAEIKPANFWAWDMNMGLVQKPYGSQTLRTYRVIYFYVVPLKVLITNFKKNYAPLNSLKFRSVVWIHLEKNGSGSRA